MSYIYDIYYLRLILLLTLAVDLSGSYFYNAYKAQEAIDNSGILWDEDFRNYLEDTGASLSGVMERGAEVLDAYIRCYEISQIDDLELEGLLTGAGE